MTGQKKQEWNHCHMPKLNSLLNKREREICVRVHQVRTDIVKWSQPDLARELDITHNQLASLEYARTPLRYGVARTLCDKCHINQRWLATGDLPIRVFVEVHSFYDSKIPLDMLFSEAYDTFLSRLVEDDLEQMAKSLHCTAADLDKHRRHIGSRWPVGAPGAIQARIYHERLLDWRVGKQPESIQNKIFRQLNAVLDQLLPGMSIADESKIEAIKHSNPKLDYSKDILDNRGGTAMVAGVSAEKLKVPTWPELKKTIERLTADRGQKAALAKRLKVSRQVLGNWLSDDSQGSPSAVLTLQLLAWVEEQSHPK